MKRKQLSGKHIGIVFGTFAPMHVGHVDLITKAKRANDNVLVIVSGSNTQEDRGTRAGLSLNRRFRYVREVFNDDELVEITPNNIRLRKKYLSGLERRKYENSKN